MDPLSLLVDVGNTNIAFALTDGQDLLRIVRIGTRKGLTSDELKTYFLCLFTPEERRGLKEALISNVVPDIEHELKVFLQDVGLRPCFVDHTKVPLRTLYKRPEEVGVDRLLVSYGARELFGPPLIVVDMGTATTFNCVSKDGIFLGGLIVPGLRTSLESLGKRGAKLPIIRDLKTAPTLIADNTVDAMKGGILFGYAALIGGLVSVIEEQMGCSTKVVITGGLSELILGLLRIQVVHEPCLLLHGLRILYKSQIY